MTEHAYDVIVLGLGGMGSAAAAHLAARGSRVLGIERFTPAHDRGASHGATLNFNESVLDWHAHGDGEGVTVRTTRGSYTAGSLVIAPGAWAPRLLPEFAPSLTVERQLLFWFAPSSGRSSPTSSRRARPGSRSSCSRRAG